ncbi:hypothetical protein PR202_ga06123 [Eleusine coracana subsp. coracana]|uniref:Uncharacterized protein n=1 Tax=Eleusine coracana subsp. coracana TaxID=191504 RepID=A0AAV5BWE4_ELECO|nr:hypothetical protein PR202_ga06123 [Eleusine coracana subsp. coracana]
MSTSWRDKQPPNLINFIATFLAGNSYRLSFCSLPPDFIFNNGGLSVAFLFETCWDTEKEADVFSRVNTLKRQFKHFYVVVTVPTSEQNEAFNHAYFKYREQAVQCLDAFVQVITSIPGIDSHDANTLAQAIGSIEAISKASKEFILENTDLSRDKAERIVRFFRDPQYYLSPKIN